MRGDAHDQELEGTAPTRSREREKALTRCRAPGPSTGLRSRLPSRARIAEAIKAPAVRPTAAAADATSRKLGVLLPILAGLAGQALTTGGFRAAFAAYIVAASAIVLLAFAASFFVAFGQESVTARMEASAPTVKRWGGNVLILVGVWFIALGVFANFFARVFPG